jgi:hypothetical protein
MKKVIRLTESDIVRLVKRIINESEGKLNNPNDGELKNPYWNEIKNNLVPKGFKFSMNIERSGGGSSYGDIKKLVAPKSNTIKNYQHGILVKNNVYVQYPYFTGKAGSSDINKIGIAPSSEKKLTPEYHDYLIRKYPVVKDMTYNRGPMVMRVNDVKSVIGLVDELSAYSED